MVSLLTTTTAPIPISLIPGIETAPEIQEEERPHWSYSAISEYMMCSLKYYFHRIEKRDPERISINLVLGKAIHAVYSYVLSLLYPKLNEPINQADLETFFVQEFDFLQDKRISYGNSSYEEIVSKGKQYCHVLVDYLMKTKNFNDNKIYELWLERDFTVPLVGDDSTVLELPLVGIFDAVIINHQKKLAQIIDFKTSHNRYPEWKLERNLQMIVYTYALQLLLGRDFRIIFRWEVLVKNKEPVIIDYDHLCSETDIVFMFKTIQRITNAIQYRIFYPNPSYLCLSCEYKRACRQWR